jgi:hypothetical protein
LVRQAAVINSVQFVFTWSWGGSSAASVTSSLLLELFLQQHLFRQKQQDTIMKTTPDARPTFIHVEAGAREEVRDSPRQINTKLMILLSSKLGCDAVTKKPRSQGRIIT